MIILIFEIDYFYCKLRIIIEYLNKSVFYLVEMLLRQKNVLTNAQSYNYLVVLVMPI
jgi:hypothetical protein